MYIKVIIVQITYKWVIKRFYSAVQSGMNVENTTT